MADTAPDNWEQRYLGQIGDDISDIRSRFGKLEDRVHGIETNMVTKEDLRRLETKVEDGFRELKGKVEHFYWFQVGLLGTVIASLIVVIIGMFEHF